MDGITDRSTCRACLKIGDKMANLFDEQLWEIFTKCTDLEVKQDDGFPSTLCRPCMRKLKQFNEFRLLCITSAETLSQSFAPPLPLEADSEPPTKVKEEESDDEPEYLEEKEGSSEAEIKTELEESDSPPSKAKTGSKRKGKYVCKTCDRRFFKQRIYVGHCRIHEGLKPYFCSTCRKEFVKLKNLDAHLATAHSDTPRGPKLICDYSDCHRTYSTEQSLRAHQRTHDPAFEKSKQPCICDTCGRIFSSNTTLKKHKMVHEGNYPFACTKPGCLKRYTTKHKLKEHIMRHEGTKNYVCSLCGLKKTTMNELRIHMNVHTRDKVFHCEHCSAEFYSTGNLSRHVKVVHLGIKAYPCSYCEKSFGKAETLKHHEMTHTGVRPHECRTCGKRFIQQVALQTHMRTHAKKEAASISSGAEQRPTIVYRTSIEMK